MKNRSLSNRIGTSLAALTLAATFVGGCASTPELDPIAPSESLVALSRIECGGNNELQLSWEARVREASLDDYPGIEREMLWILEYPQSTYPAEQFACRVLRAVGDERSVPVLAGLLTHERLAHPARFALQGIDSPDVDDALRRALGELDGDARRGVIDSIAFRGDREAVPALVGLLEGSESATQRTVLEALGRIGGEDATDALTAATVPESLQGTLLDARLACADSLLAEDEAGDAEEIYREIAGSTHPAHLRVAAWRGIVRAKPDEAVLELAGLFRSDELPLLRAATRFVLELEEGTDLTPLVARVGGFGTDARILALGALAERGTVAAVPSALAALDSEDEGVRIAGIRALGRLGSAEYVPQIAKFTWGEGAEAAAARRALEESSAPGLNEAIVASLQENDHDTIRAELIGCLVARRAEGAVPTLLRYARTGGERTRRASIAGLETLAAESDLPAAVALVDELERPRDRRAMEKTLLAICRRADAPDAAVRVLVTAYPNAEATTRISLLSVLGELPSDQTLTPLLSAATGGTVDERRAAVEALAAWPDAAPGQVLHTISLRDEESAVRLAALEGHLRMSATGPERSIAETVTAYRAAFDSARTAEEKQKVIECAGRSEQLWAVGFVSSFREDADVGALADGTWETLCSTLARQVPHAAIGETVTLEHAPVEKYAGDGPATLTDGKWGSTEHGDGRWLGYNGDDLIATIDLGEVIDIDDVRVGLLRGQRSWIFPPTVVELSLSGDGGEFRVVATLEVEPPKKNEGTGTDDAFVRFEEESGRYLRVHARHPGLLPKWHPGSGEPAWLFIDEIAVNARYEP